MIASIQIVDNVFVRTLVFDSAGDVMHGHKHPHNHLTLLARGRARVVVNGKATEYTAPAYIYIAKALEHEITALEDGTLAFCIHALRGGDQVGDVLDPDTIPDGVRDSVSIFTGIAKSVVQS